MKKKRDDYVINHNALLKQSKTELDINAIDDYDVDVIDTEESYIDSDIPSEFKDFFGN